MNCLSCKQPMDPALAPEVTHPTCAPTSFFDPLDEGVNLFDLELKQALLEMILHAAREDPRSKQTQIGPSEMGDPCDRKMAYRLAGVPETNVGFDPWPSTVGTAIHAWLREAVELWSATKGTENWVTEQEIQFPEFGGIGHGDLYRDNGTVIDWKTASKDVMKKVAKDGPPQKYITQIQLYGFGYVKTGRPVNRVALAFVPRAGWVKDMYVWSMPYDESVATKAMERLFSVAQTAMGLDVLNQPHRWEQLDPTPSDECGMCPWFNPLRTDEQGASNLGCPGH